MDQIKLYIDSTLQELNDIKYINILGYKIDRNKLSNNIRIIGYIAYIIIGLLIVKEHATDTVPEKWYIYYGQLLWITYLAIIIQDWQLIKMAYDYIVYYIKNSSIEIKLIIVNVLLTYLINYLKFERKLVSNNTMYYLNIIRVIVVFATLYYFKKDIDQQNVDVENAKYLLKQKIVDNLSLEKTQPLIDALSSYITIVREYQATGSANVQKLTAESKAKLVDLYNKVDHDQIKHLLSIVYTTSGIKYLNPTNYDDVMQFIKTN